MLPYTYQRGVLQGTIVVLFRYMLCDLSKVYSR